MKKFLALILSALLAAGLCGCAPSGGGDDPPGGQISAEQKELNEMLAALSEEEFTYSQLMGTDSLGQARRADRGRRKQIRRHLLFRQPRRERS